MNLKSIISDIVKLIDEKDSNWEGEFPAIVKTRSGKEVIYFSNVRHKIELLKDIIRGNLPPNLTNISNDALYSICSNSICDLYTEKVLHDGIEGESRTHIKKLKLEIEKRINSSLITLTHHFPAHTCLSPLPEPISIGPVTFYTNIQWVKRLELHDSYMAQILAPNEDLTNWKEELIRLMSPFEEGGSNNSIANNLYETLKNSNAVLDVEIENFENKQSRKLAKIATQAAIDSFSLIFKNEGMFIQQNLYECPTLPVSFDILASYDDKFLYPGWALTDRIQPYSGEVISNILRENENFINAAGNIISSVINKKDHPNKDLSIRWTTSLNWYAEAQREQDDAIALAKIGISLDVLSGGGEWIGILEMVKNILELDDQHVIFEKPHKTVLKEFISDLYNKGRSQIVHGNHIDRLMPFEQQRKKASKMCRIILMISAQNLINYSGDGQHNAFVKMAQRE